MRIIQMLGAFLLLVAAPAMSKGGSAWVVTQKSGEVRVIRGSGAQPASVQLRQVLTPGDMVVTGATGRAVLTQDDDYVVVSPGSRLALPREQQPSGFTRLLQQAGTMLYKIRHTGTPHFAVDTPMLAAVVKGTTFSVVVDGQRAAVQVTEGAVEVSTMTGQARRLVEGGMTVYVGRERPDEIIEVEAGQVTPLGSSEDEAVKIKGSGDSSLTTIASLTGGLVREAPTDPINTAAVGTVNNIVAGSPGAAPVVADAIDPGTTIGTVTPIVTEPVVEVVTIVAPVVAPVVQPVVEPIGQVVTPVVVPVVEPIVEVIAPVVVPVVAPVVEPIAPVIAPIVPIAEPSVAPVTAPVTGVIGSLLGG